MARSDQGFWPRYIGLALVTAGVLALQVTFTRIFSLVIWHHFTYLIIGVALLGGGAAGTFLAVRQWDESTLSRWIGRLALSYSLMILVNLIVISAVQIDPLRRQQLVQTLIGLALYFTSLFSTFFMGGLVVAGIFSRWVSQAHRLYFADMFGAGVATIAVISIIQAFGGPGTIAFLALMTGVAAVLLGVDLPKRWRGLMPAALLGQLAIFLVITLFNPIRLAVPESKELGWAMRAQGAQPEYTRWNPVGRVDVMPEITVDEPMIVGAISSTFFQQNPELEPYDLKLVTIDGTSMTGMYQFDGTDEDLQRFRFLDHAIISAVYQLKMDHKTTLKIGVGGGLDILLGRLHGAERITAIELNADIVHLLKGPYADYTGNIAGHPSTELIVAEGRSFLTRTDQQYDIIQGIGLDNLAALSGGAYVLAESYLYTVDALDQALSHLTPNGVFSWTRDVNVPPREMLRLTGLAVEALRRHGVSDPSRHIAIVANESQINATLLVSRAPFSEESITNLRSWAAANSFTMLQDPFVKLDTTFSDYLTAPDPRAYEAQYPFQIFPVTDDNPFFYNYFRWDRLEFNDAYEGRLNKFPIGNIILLVMFTMAILTSIAFILIPLLRYKRDGLRTGGAAPMLFYFSMLGVGYIFVQIVLIQRFTLFIGYPIHAVTTTIFSMLTFSAVGSLIGQRLCTTAGRLRLVLLGVAAFVLLSIVALPPIFDALLYLPDMARIVASVLLIAPIALVMGVPFPTGLRQIGAQAPEMVPWAWGMNGVFSVLGSVMVIIISMLSSFTFALAFGAVFYAGAALVAPAVWQIQRTSVAAPAAAPTLPVTAKRGSQT